MREKMRERTTRERMAVRVQRKEKKRGEISPWNKIEEKRGSRVRNTT